MAAGRAAELTEAYRDPVGRRRSAPSTIARSPRPRPAPRPRAAPPQPAPAADARRRAPAPPPPAAGRAPPQTGAAVHAGAREPRSSSCARRPSAASGRRSTRSAAATTRRRLRGFDIALVPKSQAVRRQQAAAPARPVRRAASTRAAVADAWPLAVKWGAVDERRGLRAADGVGAGARRGSWRRRSPSSAGRSRGAKLTLIPVDVRDWDAHMPLDAPAVVQGSAAGAAQRRRKPLSGDTDLRDVSS